MPVRIAFLQLLPAPGADEQLRRGLEACGKARKMGADIALFPEMWSCGYDLSGGGDAVRVRAVDGDGAFVRAFGALAARLDMAVGITCLEKHDPGPMNTFVLFDRHGREALRYRKVHTCAFEDERVLTPGDLFPVCDLDLGEDTVRVGSMICFDREFPESARLLMLRGAELILMPNACPLEINRLAALRTRAYENMLAVAVCNYPEGQPDCNGHSALFDGVPWVREEPGVRDMCVFEAPGTEGIFTADLDLGSLRRHRAEDVMGDKYRRPGTYGALTVSYER